MKKNINAFIDNFDYFKVQMLNWASQFNIFCLLDNHKYNFSSPVFECLLAAGSREQITASSGNAFKVLKKFSKQNKGEWFFGHFGYDLKNEVESLESNHSDPLGFADMFFFIPEIVLELHVDRVKIYSENPEDVLFQIRQQPGKICSEAKIVSSMQSRMDKETYINAIVKLQEHIRRGDCYEINFCQDFFSEDAIIDPQFIYTQLGKISPAPFAAFYKVEDKYCISMSPERYLKKKGNKLLSQPIKGTSKRNLTDALVDEENKNHLRNSIKERSENVTVVDLVRNDLSKICCPGSVQAEKLFEIYSFPQVHQMISTIEGIIPEHLHWTDAIKATFPMGSMTGAPKKIVMQLIEKYEQSRRGLFSGAIGYVTPQNDFDFNVVIRSIFYNDTNKYLSYKAGGGITHYSDPEKEYEECLLKIYAFAGILES